MSTALLLLGMTLLIVWVFWHQLRALNRVRATFGKRPLRFWEIFTVWD